MYEDLIPVEEENLEDEVTVEEENVIVNTGGTTDYRRLNNKPSINNVELLGNLSLNDLGIDQDFVKDNNYVHTDNNYTNEDKDKLSGLHNYDDTEIKELINGKQDEGDYATKDYVEQEIANFDFIKIVTKLPETGLVNRTYFVPKTDTETNDLYDEYMWINDKWELIGTKQIEVDLTDYVKNTDYATTDKAGVVKIKDTQGIGITSTKYLMIKSANSSSIKAGSNINQPIIPEKQHESVFYGLAKASGDTTQSVSSNAVGTYTDEAKASIKSMLGINEHVTLTQAEYDALVSAGTVDENTYYYIKEE